METMIRSPIRVRITKADVINTIYFKQEVRSQKMGWPKPEYSREELGTWLNNNPLFHSLYDLWAKSGYNKYEKPSVDRVDDYKFYTWDNIQLMTWGENREKAIKDRLSGKNTKGSEPIHQYSLDGNYIQSFDSTALALREINSSYAGKRLLYRAVQGIKPTAYGFRWSHTKVDNLGVLVDKRNLDKRLPISQFTKQGEFIRNFDSILEASRLLGVSDSNISRVCNGSRKTAGNFKWKYNN